MPSLLTVWQCSSMVSELSLDKNCLKLSELVIMYSIMISLRFLWYVSFPKSSFETALKRQLPSPSILSSALFCLESRSMMEEFDELGGVIETVLQCSSSTSSLKVLARIRR